MGKKIDRFVLGSAVGIALFFYFYRIFENAIIGLTLAFLSFLLLASVIRRLKKYFVNIPWMQRRLIRKQSSGSIMHLACLPYEEAIETVRRLVQKCYNANYPLELIQCHPSTGILPNQIFEIWKLHRGDEQLVICATGMCNSNTKILAGGFKTPRVALVDAAALTQMLTEHPEEAMFSITNNPQKAKLRLQQIFALLINRKNAPRGLLFSGVMFAMYMLNQNIFQLIGAMALLFVTLVSLRQVRRPEKLF